MYWSECLCIWGVGICVYRYIFELCVSLSSVMLCLCLWSVSLGDTQYVCLPRSPTICTFPKRQTASGALGCHLPEYFLCLWVGEMS